MALTKITGAGVEGVTISSTTDVSDQFILTNTDTGSSSGPDLVLFRQSTSSAADSDGIGRIDFRGLNDANEEINYATTYSKISDASDGTEDGEFYIQQISGGSYVTTLKIDGTGAVTKPLQPAFSLFYDSSGTEGVGNNNTVVFTGVHSNIGTHYNTSTGKFTAPVSGFYHFNLVAFGSNSSGGAVSAGSSSAISLYDWTNSATLARSYHYTQTGSFHPNMSFSSAHYLSASTEVSIVPGSGSYLYSDASDLYCKFSGFLIG